MTCDHDWFATDCTDFGAVTMECSECDCTKEIEVEFVNGPDSGISNIWRAKSRFDPPADGFVMFADSCPSTNVTHCINAGYKAENITVMSIGDNYTVWRKEAQ
jgi:hypothetical protein|tara:strand:+ start:124 stop:432 length:309 start_codon:yes stop_codon:yes gene_type:complete